MLGSEQEIKNAKMRRLDRRQDPRFIRLLNNIKDARRSSPYLDWIVFEDVEFAKSRMQAHLWATWRAAVWCQQGVHIECVPTGTLKKFATGNGNADKDMMARALTLDPRYELVTVRPPRCKVDKLMVHDTLTKQNLDDNAVDALHLLHWAMKTLEGTPPPASELPFFT